MASEDPKKPIEQHSNTELFASAKVVAEAAQSALKNDGSKFDKANVAEAAADLLDAAGKYGKLDDQKGIGQYVDKAADYLHHYQTSDTHANPNASAPSDSKPDDAKHQSGGGGGGGGGLGDFAKMAGSFLNK